MSPSAKTLQVLATMLNRGLKPRGVVVRVSYRDRHLHFLLEGSPLPSEAVYTPLLHQGFTVLQASAAWQEGQPLAEFKSLAGVIIYGRVRGQKQIGWTSRFSLDGAIIPDSPQGQLSPEASSAVLEEEETLALTPEAILAPDLFGAAANVPLVVPAAEPYPVTDDLSPGLPTLVLDAPASRSSPPPAPAWDLVEDNTAVQELLQLDALMPEPNTPPISEPWHNSPDTGHSDREPAMLPGFNPFPGKADATLPEGRSGADRDRTLQQPNPDRSTPAPLPPPGHSPPRTPEGAETQAAAALDRIPTLGSQGLLAKLLLAGSLVLLLGGGGFYLWFMPRQTKVLAEIQLQLLAVEDLPVQSLDQLKTTESTLQTLLDRLQGIPWIAGSAHGQAQEQAEQLRQNLEVIQLRRESETAARDNLQEAKRLGAEATQAWETQQITDPIVLQTIYEKWVAAQYFLTLIPPESWAYGEAQPLKVSYTQNLWRVSQLQQQPDRPTSGTLGTLGNSDGVNPDLAGIPGADDLDPEALTDPTVGTDLETLPFESQELTEEETDPTFPNP
ncbi:hypothetical protein [Prochlorothrix hollandica]|uniref:hypothetical protein n=1 Tax=Prochlorothrix hollandica TaxID=1223 RepID=UPI0033412056